MTMQLYQVLGKKKLTVQKLHTQVKMFYTSLKKANNWGDLDTALNVQNFTLMKSFMGKCSTRRKQGHKVQIVGKKRRMCPNVPHGEYFMENPMTWGIQQFQLKMLCGEVRH